MQADPIIDRQPTMAHAAVAELLHKRLSDLRDGFRQNVVLLGPRGAGKSSLLLTALTRASQPPAEARTEAPAAPLLIVYCEGRRESWESWARRFVGAVLEGLAGFQVDTLRPLDVPELLRKAYGVAPRTAQAIAELLPQIRSAPQERLFRQVLDLPYTAAEETGRPGVVVLDEFQELEHVGIHRPFHELGKRIMLERSMLYLLASSQPTAARRILRERLNLLFGGFEVVDVDDLDEPAGETFLREHLAARRLPQPFPMFLARLTGGHAWSLGTLTNALARRGGHGDWTPSELLQALAEELADARQPLAAWCAEQLAGIEVGRAGSAYVHALTVLAGRRATPRALAQTMHQTVTETSRQLSRLLEQGLLDRQGEVYTLKSPLWSFWFRQVHIPRQAALTATVQGMTDWVRVRLDEEWQQFVTEQTVAPLQRFLQLLNQFGNELVRVDSRRVRLPAFRRVDREALGPGVHQVTAQPATGAPWLYFVKERQVDETDVSLFAQRLGRLARRPGTRVVVSLDGFDSSAQLLAKVSKFWVWHGPALQTLYRLYQLPALSEGT